MAKKGRVAGDGEVLSLPSYKHNLGVLTFCRVVASVLAGIATGILGITGWKGFLVYLALHFSLGVPLSLKAGFDAKKYFSKWSTLLTSLVFTSQGLLSFLLFWIIFYNIAYVF